MCGLGLGLRLSNPQDRKREEPKTETQRKKQTETGRKYKRETNTKEDGHREKNGTKGTQ